jgi:hypothetical protein
VEHKESEHHSHEYVESVVEHKMALNEIFADQMKKNGIQSEPVAIASHPIESRPSSSHMFSLTSRFTTNRGLIKVKGRNIDYVQILQRN